MGGALGNAFNVGRAWEAARRLRVGRCRRSRGLFALNCLIIMRTVRRLAADFTSFTGLATNGLTSVANTFALIWLWLAYTPDTGRNLTNQLLVNTRHTYPGGLGGWINTINGQRNARRWLNFDRMGVTNLDHQALAHLGSAVTDAMDFQLFCIPIRHSNNHVVDERTIKTMLRLVLFAIGRTSDCQISVLKL